MKPDNPPKIAVLLVNLGTPSAPTPQAVRSYLNQFLSDTRVIEMPKFLWQIILKLFVLPSRPKKVAEGYKAVWDTDSPMRKILNNQAIGLQTMLNARTNTPVIVEPAMTYGEPALSRTLATLHSEGVRHFVIAPLYPQYSATTTGAVFDAMARTIMQMRDVPAVSFLRDYHAHPAYIQALANSVRAFWQIHGKPDKLMMSFHGIPKPYADKGDPYGKRCRCTAAQVAVALGLGQDEWLCTFQSRFGAQEWLKPYTDETLRAWGNQGVQKVHVLSPSFSADCLETLEELDEENRENFLHAGGKEYHYIPALNENNDHIALIADLVLPHVEAWRQNLYGYYAHDDGK